jgi:hypothetical protein
MPAGRWYGNIELECTTVKLTGLKEGRLDIFAVAVL